MTRLSPPSRGCLCPSAGAGSKRVIAITPIEGLARDEQLHPLQQAFHDNHALRCGFCTPGMIMQALDLLAENPEPDDQQVREGLEGNLCRCTGYQNIVRAVRDAAQRMREAGESARPAPPTPEAGEAETPDSGLPREQVPGETIPQPVP